MGAGAHRRHRLCTGQSRLSRAGRAWPCLLVATAGAAGISNEDPPSKTAAPRSGPLLGSRPARRPACRTARPAELVEVRAPAEDPWRTCAHRDMGRPEAQCAADYMALEMQRVRAEPPTSPDVAHGVAWATRSSIDACKGGRFMPRRWKVFDSSSAPPAPLVESLGRDLCCSSSTCGLPYCHALRATLQAFERAMDPGGGRQRGRAADARIPKGAPDNGSPPRCRCPRCRSVPGPALYRKIPDRFGVLSESQFAGAGLPQWPSPAGESMLPARRAISLFRKEVPMACSPCSLGLYAPPLPAEPSPVWAAAAVAGPTVPSHADSKARSSRNMLRNIKAALPGHRVSGSRWRPSRPLLGGLHQQVGQGLWRPGFNTPHQTPAKSAKAIVKYGAEAVG
ncbi:hypothetical protein FQR65_LT20956 [Abscondita terminalis]|nr:hypothetical protein FQR65_LT20956 [Abscondita terminalis]